MTQVGQCPVEPHKLQPPGATPGPATYSRVRNLEKRPGREPGDFVGSTPTSVTHASGMSAVGSKDRPDGRADCRLPTTDDPLVSGSRVPPAPVVKRTSSLASNEAFQVQVLVGVFSLLNT